MAPMDVQARAAQSAALIDDLEILQMSEERLDLMLLEVCGDECNSASVADANNLLIA